MSALNYLLSCSHEVIDQLEVVHAELLGNCAPISRFPVRDICRTDDVILDLASDANDTDLGPICRATLISLQ